MPFAAGILPLIDLFAVSAGASSKQNAFASLLAIDFSFVASAGVCVGHMQMPFAAGILPLIDLFVR